MRLFEVVCRWSSGLVSCRRWVINAESEDAAKSIAQADEGEMGWDGTWSVFTITPDKDPAILFSMSEYS